jgi:uncharacterized membrane protein
MISGVLAVVAASFLAAAVEVVEALTIVLALGVTRDWRSTLLGVGAALIVLAALIGTLGPTLASIPIGVLRLVVGGLILIFGLQWLRKAILRAAGYQSKRDESAIYDRAVQQARATASPVGPRMDWYAFTVSFKSVLLEGLEVAFIVVAFGAIAGSVAPALVGTSLAIVAVVAAGIALRSPLSHVPENRLKFVVGALLTSLGLFWSVEGLGIAWPMADEGAIPLIIVFVVVDSFSFAYLLRYLRPPAPEQGSTRVVRSRSNP